MISKLQRFLLKNTTTKQIIIKNTFWLLFAELINKGGIFFVTIFIAQTLGREQFGILSYVMSTIGMCMVLMDFGLTTVMVRGVSQNPSQCSSYLVNISFLKIILGGLLFLFVSILSLYVVSIQVSISLIITYCLYVIINNFSEFIRAFFRPSEDMQYEAYLKIINGIIFVAITLYILLYFPTIENIVYGYLISSFLGLICSIIFILRRFHAPVSKIDIHLMKSFLHQGFYIGLGSFFIALYMNSDQIIMGIYSQFEALGIYALAYKVSLMIAMVGSIIFTTLLPRVSQGAYQENGISNYKKGLKIIFQYNFLLILGIEFILLALYRMNFGQYQAIIPIIQWLLLYNFIEPLGYWGYLNLVSSGREKANLYVVMIVGILNVIGNVILIPIYSYYGAIFTTIASYLLYFIIINSIVLGKFLAKK